MATRVSTLTAATPTYTDVFAVEDVNDAKKLTLANLTEYVTGGAHLVDNYGATGDGSDDSVAIQAAIVAAGANGTVVFTAGKTYGYGRSHYFYPGQTFIGYGATVKRIATVSSQIGVGGVSGNDITVADGTKFESGMQVAGWADTNEFTVITIVDGAPAGNVVSVLQFTQASEAIATPGDNDYLVVVPIFLSGELSGNATYGIGNTSPDDVKVLGLTFDGNVAQNGGAQSALRWELLREFSSMGDRCIFRDCTFKNTPGEGVVGLGNDSKVAGCHFSDVNGNGLHFSAGDRVSVSGCTFDNINVLQRGTTDTFTATNATNTITFTTETPVDGQVITVSSSTRDLPSNLSALQTYYAVSSSGSDCQLSLTVGGSAVTFSDDGSGTLTARIGTNLGHQGGAIDFSTVCSDINIVDINVDGALSAIASIGAAANGSGSVFTNINARNCDKSYIQCESTLEQLVITGGIAESCTIFQLQGDGVSVKNVTCIDTPVFMSTDNSSIDIVVTMASNTVDDCLQVAGDNNMVNAVCTGGYTGLSFAGGAVNNTVKIKAINNYANGIEIGGTNNALTDANVVEPHIILESGYGSESSSYRGIDFGGCGIVKGGTINATIGASGRAIDVRANADNAVIDGLMIIEAGTPADLCRINGENDVTCRNMTFPNGTSSANAFTIGASTGFTPINNYALGSGLATNSGTGSITSGGTTDVIAHGLNITPAAADIQITLTENPTNTPGAIWVDSIDGTNFTVNCENDPGASNLDFSWKVTSNGLLTGV